MNALILVDLQNDFMPGGALPVTDGHSVVPIANRLMPHFDIVVATQDWHPAEHISFASRHAGFGVGDRVEIDGIDQILWPDHCVQGTAGAALHDDLAVQQIHHTVRKGTQQHIDSYSGFFDNGRLQATNLADKLKDFGTTRVAVMGLATDYCVKFTARDSAELGFHTTVIEDGCRGVDANTGDVDRALQDMQRAGIEVLSSEQITGRLER